MDNHLNLFYGYSQGGYKNLEEMHILEDNVTRAFIISLKEIPELAIKFLKDMVGIVNLNESCEVKYDLQNFDDDIKIAQSAPLKYIVGISNSGELDCCEYFEKVRAELVKNKYKISKSIKSKEELNGYLEKIIKNEELNYSFLEKLTSFNKIEDNEGLIDYLYDITKGSRPDAWIYQENKFALIIENKINGNLNREQLIRHFSDEKGFNIKHDPNFSKRNINFSWVRIYNLFKENVFDDSKKELFRNDFLHYLELAGLTPLRLKDDLLSSDPDEKNWIKKQIYMISNMAVKHINSKNRKVDFIVKNHTLSKNYIGVDIIEKKLLRSKESFSDIVHISIGTNTESRIFSVYIDIEKVKKVRKLVELLRNDSQHNTLINVFNKLNLISNVPAVINIHERWFIKRGDMEYFKKPLIVIDKNLSSLDIIADEMQKIFNENVLIKKIKRNKRKQDIEKYYENRTFEYINKFFLQSKSMARTVTPTLNVSYEFNYDFINKQNKTEEIIINAIDNLMPLYNWLINNLEEVTE